ncbi:hypothetical protein F5148DRAFT_1226753, partial [Russula earlei]
MRISSIFATFCLAIGIAPSSFALPLTKFLRGVPPFREADPSRYLNSPAWTLRRKKADKDDREGLKRGILDMRWGFVEAGAVIKQRQRVQEYRQRAQAVETKSSRSVDASAQTARAAHRPGPHKHFRSVAETHTITKLI